MAKKRGFFAELQYQNQLATKRYEQQAQAIYREQVAAVKEAERARAAAAQFYAQIQKQTAVEQKAAEKEARRLHLEARQAEVEVRNGDLRRIYDEMDSMLSATLAVDDHVDLERLRIVAVHPPFASLYEVAPQQPQPPTPPPEPRYMPPAEPGRLGGMLGGKQRYAETEAAARAAFAQAHAAWGSEMQRLGGLWQQAQGQHAQADQQRLAYLGQAHATYAEECRVREAQATQENRNLEAFIAALSYGVEEAVQEYVSIVLSNSVYPDAFLVEHDFVFDSTLRELALIALIPPPDQVPRVREYKYVPSKDEITESTLPQKEFKERYLNAVTQVAIRSLHEVFEADRAGRIQTIALTVATQTVDRATGLTTQVPLAVVASDRDTFMSFDLSNVVPLETLKHLGAQISRNPADLAAVDTSKGVRGR